MEIVVLANASQKQELTNGIDIPGVVWVEDVHAFQRYNDADVFVDLGFENTEDRKTILSRLVPKLVVVNSVADTLADINPSFVRINGWNTFLSSTLLEAAATSEAARQKTGAVFSLFGKQLDWLSDSAGFVTPRLVSMIINEAYLALDERVSTKDEINTAMKLGTAYPWGPFEWAEKIGVQNIVALLQKLSRKEHRYHPAVLLTQETGVAI